MTVTGSLPGRNYSGRVQEKFCPDIARRVDDHGDGGKKVSYERYFIFTKIS